MLPFQNPHRDTRPSRDFPLRRTAGRHCRSSFGIIVSHGNKQTRRNGLPMTTQRNDCRTTSLPKPQFAFLERDHPQQVFASALRIRISLSAGDPAALLAQRASFQLPYEVAHNQLLENSPDDFRFLTRRPDVSELFWSPFFSSQPNRRERSTHTGRGCRPPF